MAEKQRLSERVKKDLLALIGNQFAPGDRLPNELVLSQTLGISRTTLRESIRLLIEDGVLEIRRGLGTFIKASGAQGPDALSTQGRAAPPPGQTRDLYEIRLIVEPKAAYLAALRASDGELAQLAALGQKVAQTLLDGGDVQTAEQTFRQAMFSATHNTYLQSFSAFLDGAAPTVSHAALRYLIPDHQAIVDFLLRRSGEGASAAMRLHLMHLFSELDYGTSPGSHTVLPEEPGNAPFGK